MTRAFLTAVLVAAPGCVAITDFGALRAEGDASVDGSTRDAGPSDAGPRPDGDVGLPDAPGGDAGACPGGCGGDEMCCDGTCVDVRSSLSNCGGCGITCEGGPHQSAQCVERICELGCEPDFGDCTAEPGCETSLTTLTDCGECGLGCGAGELCGAETSDYTCRSSCPTGQTNCSGTCADLETDPRHCRACGMTCDERPGAAESCGASGCEHACDAGRADCNGDLVMASGDGCETLLVLQYPDADGDGYGSMLAAGTLRCPGPGFSANRTDCDDTLSTRSPGLAETCDGVDNDCDGSVDDGFLLGGVPRTVGDDCTCEAGAATARIVCDGASAVRCAYPTEACNGWDDDCSGGADDTFACVRGEVSSCLGTGVGGCRFSGTSTCSGACVPGGCLPPDETCNAVDDDCDGFVDDAVVPFGAPIPFTSLPFVGQVRTAWASAATGGALVASASGSMEQLLFARFDRDGAVIGTPIVIDTHPMYAVIGDVGWDGTQWVVMYSRYNSTRSVSEILRVHVSTTGTLTRPTGTVIDAESVAITPNGAGTALGVTTGRYLGTSGVGMYYGVYASGVFTRPLSVLNSSATLSRAHVVAAGPTSFYAVGSDVTGVYFQRFDATGTLDVLYRPVVATSTDVFGADFDGTNLIVLYRDGSDVRLRAVSSIGTTRWNTLLRSSGFQGPVGMIGSEIWASLSDGTAFRVRGTDGTVFPESYPRYCEAFLATPDGPLRGLCAAAGSLVPIRRCP